MRVEFCGLSHAFFQKVVKIVGILQSTLFGLALQQLLRSTAIINNLERYKEIFECILQGILKEVGNEDELKLLIDSILENIEQPRFLEIAVVIANIINEVGTYDKKNIISNCCKRYIYRRRREKA